MTDQYRDPVAFIRTVLVNPETGRPFELYPAQERWFRAALTPLEDGSLPYAELVYSALKKSGKTATAAMALLFVVVVLGGPYAEGYTLANDLEQAQGRVFRAVTRIVEASPVLKRSAKVTANQVEFTSTGSTITAIASDYTGAAGGNPTISVFDELWGYVSERSKRLWDEMVPVPTRKVSVRLTTTYAGFEGESLLLWDLYQRGLRGEQVAPSLYRQPGMLMAWHHEPVAPWQTEAWLEQMRRTQRPNAYTRQVENRFASGTESFIPVEWWDALAVEQRPLAGKDIPVVVAVDAGLKRDSAAVVACSWSPDERCVWLIDHRVFVPRKGEVLDLEATLEAAVLEMARRWSVREVRYDPWQFARSAQTLEKAGLRMEEFPQSVSNLTAMGNNLYELLRDGNLAAYAAPEIRSALQSAVAVETPRGLKIAKEKTSQRIDAAVALAMAALGAVQLLVQGESEPTYTVFAASGRRF